MGRRLLLVNILILIGIVLTARHLTDAWSKFEDEKNPQKILRQVTGDGPREVEVVVPPLPAGPQPYPDFAVIPEKDLFSPDRRPPPPPGVEQVVAEKPPPLPKPPSLNGVLTNDGKRQALVTIYDQPNNTKGQSRLVAVGDTVQGYTVTEIADTILKMKWKEHEVVLDMFDAAPQQQAAVAKGKSAAVTVITIGSPSAPVETSAVAETGATDDRRGSEPAGSVPVPRQLGGTRGGANNPSRSANPAAVPADNPAQGSGIVGVPSGAGNSGESVPFTGGVRRRNR
jgi:hypothetical protein